MSKKAHQTEQSFLARYLLTIQAAVFAETGKSISDEPVSFVCEYVKRQNTCFL